MGSGVWLKGRGVALDRFDRPAKHYFLSHAHYDHMAGLRRGWNRGPVVCSPLTARVLRRCVRVAKDVPILEISPGETLDFPGFRAHALDARHIPGSLLFLLEFPDQRVLFTGDLKAEPDVVESVRTPLWRDVDVLYLDATYGHPRYRFPSRADAAREVARRALESDAREIFIATYSLGRLPLLQRLAAEFDRPVYVSAKILKTFEALGFGSLVTSDRDSTHLRGYMRGYLEGAFLEYRKFRPREHLVIIPTGWALDGEPAHPDFVYIAYSDHSDHAELSAFVEAVRPREIIPIAGTPVQLPAAENGKRSAESAEREATDRGRTPAVER